MSSYAIDTNKNYNPNSSEPVMKSIFKQYEYVIIESIVTSFGLDFLVKDQHGGDVDTIHNVRQVGKDEKMTYKNDNNKENYDGRGEYKYRDYHGENTNFSKKKADARKEYRESGKTVEDAYTGDDLHFLGKSKGANPKINAELDHVISSKSIHDDQGRVLAGLKGTDLADAKENLKFTNKSLNASMQDKDIPEYIAKHPELSNEVKDGLMRNYEKSKKSYEAKLAKAYYTSPKFAKDVTKAAGKVGIKMGVRQVLGLIFTEIWFEVKKEFDKIDREEGFDLGRHFSAIGTGIKNGFENAKLKHKELFSRFISGALAGALSSVTTTLCNIFFTTAKNVVKIIRQSYASMVEAAKVLFLNPENYGFGERMRAVSKILSIGASVVLGVVVSEAIEKTPIGTIPVIGEIVQTFCGSLVTGIMSCTLLYCLDNNKTINKIVKSLDEIHTIETEINYYRDQADYFEKYAAKLMNIDIDKLRQETAMFNNLAKSIDITETEEELNCILKNAVKAIGIKVPWNEYADFNSFMDDDDSLLVFE